MLESSADGRLLTLDVAMKSGIAGLMEAWADIRARSSREAIAAAYGLDFGFRIEDAVAVRVTLPAHDDAATVWAWLDRQLPEACARATVVGERQLQIVLRERVGQPTKRPVYTLDAQGRVRVEAFELHVVEDCNLRCANCCNMSPFVDVRRLSVDELREQLATMASVLSTDVFKIMGGEPLLHPRIDEMIVVARESGIGAVVRLFTNGLLLKRMKESFWRALDQLTISSYASAPVPQRTLEHAYAKAVEYGFILNVKPVTSFSQVLSPRYIADVQETYDTCWLRHRCLIVRNGRFYKCTRAAYAGEFHQRIQREQPPAGLRFDDDGVALPASAATLRDYMSSGVPLASCHYCLAGNGPLERHHQLSKREVEAGVLRRA